MAEPKVLFNVTETAVGSNTGSAPTQAKQGDTPTNYQGIMALGWKDSAGNLVLPALTTSGRIPVDTEGVIGTFLRASAQTAVSGSTVSFQSITAITLTNSVVYSEYSMLVGCRRGGIFQVVWGNNGVNTILGETILDAGMYTMFYKSSDQFTSGATGGQSLTLQGKNYDIASDMHGALTVIAGA